MNIRTLLIAIATFATALLTSCDEHLEAPDSGAAVTLQLNWGDTEQPDNISDGIVTFKNINTGQVTTFALDTESISVAPGLYDISLTATAALPNGGVAEVKAFRQSVTIAAGDNAVELSPFCTINSDDFIISEIFFTGTLQPSGNQYYGDDYIKIYNNTDHVLYADGLTIFESKFTTTQKFEYSPDIMSEAMTVHALYTVPGSGKEHPVNPGEYLLIADTGIDHTVINPNSFDLSSADFEWYDVSTKPAHTDIDSPTVPNLDKWYCYTLSFFVLHNRGFRAYGIARIPVDKDEYLKDYWYTYDYTIVVPAGTFPTSQSASQLPHTWIVDVVNCSVAAEYEWNVSDPSLDMGWTNCGTIDHDKTRYFHAVRRKLAGFSATGTPIFQDTNNSTEDFNAMVTPSEIERQGTAKDINGTPCTVQTYDGVVPIEKSEK